MIDAAGHARPWATLESLHDRRWRVTWAESAPAWARHFSDREGLWDGFPFFLADVRPQGFLGRAIAGQVARALGVPDDPRQWSDEHTLVYLLAAGEDVPGALVVGDECLRRALARVLVPEEESLTNRMGVEARYPLLAERVPRVQPGSSAGGEQPKFLTTLREADGASQPVLVKFSPPLDQPAGQRWADLLLAEYHALAVLAEHGLANAGAGLLAADALGTVQRLHAFGELIGNSDMHAGNLAFWLSDTLPLNLTPAYDMPPMLWAPGVQGEFTARRFAPAPPLPAALGPWREAAGWAAEVWARLAGDPQLSADFHSIARGVRATLETLRAHVG